MSAALQRLVGRATGALAGGLRPRLSQRFETGATEAGLREIHAEVQSRAAPQSGPVPEPLADERPAHRTTAVAEPPSEPPRTPAVVRAAAGRQPAAPAASEISTRSDRRPTVAAEPTRTAPPAPLLHETAVARDAPPAPMAMNAVAVEEVLAPVRAPVPPRAAPEPFRAPERVPRMPEALVVASPGRPSGGAALQPASEPSAPEITIHIGRIDVREAARQAGTPQQTVRPQPLPALADYLRGGRS